MTKPRYFSVKCISGELRGFLFCVILVAGSFMPAMSQPTRDQTANVLLLVFGGDSVSVARHVSLNDVQEMVYEEAWRYGYFRSELKSHQLRLDTLIAEFKGPGRFKWTSDPILWNFDITDGIYASDCRLSNRWYDENEVEACIRLQTDELVRQGFLDPSITLDSLIIEDGSLSVSAAFSIQTGEPATLSEVTWNGLSKTGSIWLNKVIGAQKGLVLNQANIARMSQKLSNTRLFDDVSEPEVIKNDQAWELSFTVKERPLTFFDLIVGYVPDQSGTAVIVGNGALHIRNAGFDGTELRVNFDRQSPRVGKMSIDVDQNLLFGYPLGINGAFSLARQDSLWQNRASKVGIWWDIHESIRVFAAVQREVSTTATSTQTSANLWGTYGQIGIAFDTRNDAGITRSGLSATLVVESGRQIVEPILSDRYNQSRRKITNGISVYIPLSSRNILIPSTSAATILTEREPFLNDLFRIGGAKSLRGYREDQFFASSYLWGDLEYRYLLDTSSYLFAFGSAGWLWTPPNESARTTSVRNEVRSFGLGLALRTNLGLLKLTYAKSPDDPFANAKVHVGVSSGF